MLLGHLSPGPLALPGLPPLHIQPFAYMFGSPMGVNVQGGRYPGGTCQAVDIQDIDIIVPARFDTA